MPINPEEIVAHEEEIASYCSMVGGIPQLDIVLLGMGVDGHTASLFPNTSVLYPGAGWIGYTNHPQSGQVRITMSPQLLSNARSRVFLIIGKEKQTVLQNAMNRDPFLPISQLLAQQNTWVITDAA